MGDSRLFTINIKTNSIRSICSVKYPPFAVVCCLAAARNTRMCRFGFQHQNLSAAAVLDYVSNLPNLKWHLIGFDLIFFSCL